MAIIRKGALSLLFISLIIPFAAFISYFQSVNAIGVNIIKVFQKVQGYSDSFRKLLLP